MDFNFFAGRVVVGLWQSWDSGLPEFAVNYFWCVEPQKSPCPLVQNQRPDPCQAMIDHPPIPQCAGNYPVVDPNTMMPVTRCGEFTCAKTNIIIADLADPSQGLLAKCTCEVLGLLDTLVALIFNLLSTLPGLEYATWSCCLCGGYNPETNQCSRRTLNFCQAGQIFTPLSNPGETGGSGVLPAASYIIGAVTTALFRLMRQIPFSCYWHPSLAYGSPVPTNIAQTWIFSFGGPTADALCIAVGNMQCFANSMFFLPQRCLANGEKFLGGTVRWAAEGVFRIVGFIEAFINTLIALPWSCIGGNCGPSAGFTQPPVKGINSRRLGEMLVILLSWPFDALIGDAAVACTTICPSTFAVPRPDSGLEYAPFFGCQAGVLSCSCGCWNDSPNYANRRGRINNIPPYQWTPSTDPNGVCKDRSPQAVQQNLVRHVGEIFGRTDGCCVLTNPTLTSLPTSMPACQSPDDSDLYFGTNSDFAGVITHDPIGYPGSCAYLGACRPDALPSCANDPMTPLNLSLNYRGALDGMVLAFLKYMRCLLDYTLTCQRAGAPCDPKLQFGIVFYPAILIFSLIWQLLGGLIRFMVAIVIFFFTLFTPPEGGPCQCWGGTYVDGYGDDATAYYVIGNQWFFGGFCYPCRTPNVDCGKSYFGLPGKPVDTRDYAIAVCKPYCPVFHKLFNPGLSTADALNMCLAAYAEFSPKLHPTFSAMEICTGRIMVPHTVYEFRPDYTDGPQAVCTLNPCVPTLDVDNSCFTTVSFSITPPFFRARGLCDPFNNAGCGSTPSEYYIPVDMCADPTCQDPANATRIGDGNAIGVWPDGCGYSAFSSTSPNNPLVQCGVLQIVSAFLDVFRAFVAIFDTPFFITPNESRRRSANESSSSSASNAFATIQKVIQLATKENRTRFEKSSTREPRQVWNHRMKGRFSGLLSGPSIEDNTRPNFAESLASALFAYDMSDCYDDPVTCACRNLDMPSHCYLDGNGTLVFPGRKRQHMTTSELNTMLSQEMFTGTTVCDHVMSSHAGQDWDTEVTMNQKHPWVNCLDKYVQGSRMSTLTDGVVPSDILYNGQAPVTFVHNLFNSAKRAVRADSSARIKARMAEGMQRNVTRILEDFEHKFPNWHEQLRNRTLFAHEFVQKEYGITPDHLMFDAIVKADLLAFKYQSGYYRFLIHEASKVVTSGDLGALIPTKEEALQEVRNSFDDLRKIFWSQRFTDITVASYHAARKVGDAAWDVYEEGVHKWASRQWTTFDAHAKRRGDPEQPERVRLLKESIQASPLWRMWFASAPNDTTTTTAKEEEEVPRTSLFGPFIEHMGRVFAHYRSKDGVQNSVAFWNLDIHFWSAKDILTRRWQNPKWTPQKLEAWDQLHRLVMRVQHWIWPDSLTEEQQKRFIYGGNCVLIDRTVNLTMQAVDYCANEYMANVRDVADELFRSITDHSVHKEHYYHGWRQRQHFNYELMPLSLKQNDTLAWRRPRLNVTSAAAHYHARWKARELHKQVDRRAYRRAVVQERHGPAGMDFYDQLLVWVENLFQLTFTAEADTWFDAVREWFLNPNTNVESYPDVGFRYWVRFPFVCHFPQSLNCSIGVGLEMGLLYTIITMLVVAVVGAYVFSPITLPFQFLTYPLAFVIILGAWSYHWSPACAFPPPFVGIPMCLADDVYAFLNKWITNCYVPLVLPAYMVAGETCPADPAQYIDVLSCAQIGIRDGFQNWLYLGHWVFGTAFSDTFLQVSSALFSAFLPGVHTYFARTLEAFMSAGSTDQERLTFCFWATSPAMVTPLLVGVLLIGVGVAVGLAAVALLEGLVRLYMAGPASVVVKGTENNVWYEDPEPEESEPLGSDSSSPSNENAPAVAAAVAAAAPIGTRGSWFTNWMHGGPPPPPKPSSKAWEKKNQ